MREERFWNVMQAPVRHMLHSNTRSNKDKPWSTQVLTLSRDLSTLCTSAATAMYMQYNIFKEGQTQSNLRERSTRGPTLSRALSTLRMSAATSNPMQRS